MFRAVVIPTRKEGEMPPSTKQSLIAANDRLMQDNMDLQQQLDEMTRRFENTASLYAQALGALDQVEKIIRVAKNQYTPTTDGSGLDLEAGW